MVITYKLDDLMKIVNNNDIVVVKISTNSCMPCKMVSKTLEDIENERGDVVIVSIDAEDCDDGILEKFGVRGVPVVSVFKNGVESSRTVGLQTKEQIINRL